MSRRDDQVSLQDILRHAREAVDLIDEASRHELGHNRVLQLALTHLVEIVGEAANRVSQAKQRENPEVPWDQIIGMRNRLVHGYGVIDFDLLWDTATNDLPPLIETLEKIVSEGA